MNGNSYMFREGEGEVLYFERTKGECIGQKVRLSDLEEKQRR
jgi:hypothetical protein